MLSVSHTYVSLYATSDNETHFRMVQVSFNLVENFAIPAQPLYIGGALSSRRAFLLAFPPVCPPSRHRSAGPYRQLCQ
jgi:hypothetical protein